MTYASRRFVLEKHFFMTNEAMSFPATVPKTGQESWDGGAIRGRTPAGSAAGADGNH
ncbi:MULTISPECIES: hypothetical protein [unclassified Pseudomonas]|uniref:hypothetical protein n=1 Tax=unclassified Pseudomonas TaxID=196821 RepID=UPI0015A34453|nr:MULTISPECIES: hypothetical protein [unclassified Pseudomonas]